MKRNRYAAVILVLLLALLVGSGCYVNTTAQTMRNQLQTAYACSVMQDYTAARYAYQSAAEYASQKSHWLALLVRRNLLDKVNETMATLPSYANPDNQADLSVETARACRQIDQMQWSFIGIF